MLWMGGQNYTTTYLWLSHPYHIIPFYAREWDQVNTTARRGKAKVSYLHFCRTEKNGKKVQIHRINRQ